MRAALLFGLVGVVPVAEGGTAGLVGTPVLQFEGHVPANLLFLSVDTTRKDHLGPYGALGLTPFLDHVGDRSVVAKDHAQCSNWTFDSVTCTLAGRLHTERGHIPRIDGRSPVPAGTPFLSTWLGDAGFYSILVSSNNWLGEAQGNAQGFDEIHPGSGNGRQLILDGAALLEDAIARGDASGRWFLHLHLLDPHAPYDPDPWFVQGIDDLNPWPADLRDIQDHYGEVDDYPDLDPKRKLLLQAHLRRLYEAEIRTTDARIAAGWSRLESAGLLDDTLVVIWNDHGEQMWEHGDQSHAYQLNSEENDGILMFWAENIVPGSWGGPTHAVDLVATLLDLYGVPTPPEVTGIPIGRAPAERPLFTSTAARAGVQQAVIFDGYKLQYRWSDGRVQVYHREVDPKETTDLYQPGNVHPVALKLWSLLVPQITAMDALVVESPIWPAELPSP